MVQTMKSIDYRLWLSTIPTDTSIKAYGKRTAEPVSAISTVLDGSPIRNTPIYLQFFNFYGGIQDQLGDIQIAAGGGIHNV